MLHEGTLRLKIRIGVRPVFFFSLFVLFGFLAFNVAFNLVMLAAVPARDGAAEAVPVFYLLIIFCFLLALKLGHACALPILVRHGGSTTFVVRRTTLQKTKGVKATPRFHYGH